MNVGFMQLLDPTHIALRVFERGAGETLACGTGACAAVVVGDAAGLAGGGRNGASVVARRRFVCPMAQRQPCDDDGRGGVGV